MAGCSSRIQLSRIRILVFYPSRIRYQKGTGFRIRIRNTVPDISSLILATQTMKFTVSEKHNWNKWPSYRINLTVTLKEFMKTCLYEGFWSTKISFVILFQFIRKPLGLKTELAAVWIRIFGLRYQGTAILSTMHKYFGKEQACRYDTFCFSNILLNRQKCWKNSYNNKLFSPGNRWPHQRWRLSPSSSSDWADFV